LAHVRIIVFVLGVGVLGVDAATASAQSLTVGIEYDRDRFTYHFENPSNIDTPGLVPHFFEQRYVADNVWIVATARYGKGVRWETSGGLTPQRTATADDFDTFLDPDGTVVSGTTGGNSIHSWRVGQLGIIGDGAVRTVVGYRLRVDRSDFQLGHSTTVKNGKLTSAYDTVDPEFTSSRMQEIVVGLRAQSADGRPWQLRLDGQVAPAAIGRLSIQLPVKYPGQDLIYQSNGASGAVQLTMVHSTGPIPLMLSVSVGKTWSYKPESQLYRTTFGLQIGIGR
jgi:hypothetical protein